MAWSRLFNVYWILMRDRMSAREYEVEIVRTKRGGLLAQALVMMPPLDSSWE